MEMHYIEGTRGTVVEYDGVGYTLLGDVECRLNDYDAPVEPHAFVVDQSGAEHEMYWWCYSIDEFDINDPVGILTLDDD